MSEPESDIAVFKASFPPIQSAILISGDGNGGSIKLAIPEMEAEIFTQLIGMRRDELIVTIQRAPRKPNEHGETTERSQSDRRADRATSSLRLH